jgi:rRNA maturation protein Nop10
MAANQTNIKNTAIDIPGYEERNKDNKEWYEEECRQLLEQTNKAKPAIFSLTNKSKESRTCEEKEMGAHSV